MGLRDQQSSKGLSNFFTATCSLQRAPCQGAAGSRKAGAQATLCPCPAGTGGRLACLGSQGLPVSLSRWRLHIRSSPPPLCTPSNLSRHRLPSSHPPASPAATEDLTAGSPHDRPRYRHRGACAGCDSAPPNRAVAHSWGHILQSLHQDLGPSGVGGPHGGSSHRRQLTHPGSQAG